MIFVSVGTQKFQFDRLLSMVDHLIEKGIIKEEVVAQTGNCKYIPQNITKCMNFIAENELQDIMERSDCVIVHGGVGIIMQALERGKKIIAVPRSKKYHEHVDNHQAEIVREFQKEGYLNRAENEKELEELLKNREKLQCKPFEKKSNEGNIEAIIRQYIGANK